MVRFDLLLNRLFYTASKGDRTARASVPPLAEHKNESACFLLHAID